MSDEVWNLYKGSGIHIYTWDETDAPPKRIKLSAEQNNYCHIIPAGVWQAAEPISGEVLVGCSVAPGFDFADFTLIDQDSEEARKIISVAPELVRFIVE